MILKCFWQETCWIWGSTWWLPSTEAVLREACGLRTALRSWGWPSTSTAARCLRLGPPSPSLSSPLSKRQPSSLCCSSLFSWGCWLCAVFAFSWTPTAACLLPRGRIIWKKTHLTTASPEGPVMPHDGYLTVSTTESNIAFMLVIPKVAWCLIFWKKKKNTFNYTFFHLYFYCNLLPAEYLTYFTTADKWCHFQVSWKVLAMTHPKLKS